MSDESHARDIIAQLRQGAESDEIGSEQADRLRERADEKERALEADR